VFVGNLSESTTQRELQALFSEAGEVVEVFLPADRMTGGSRGFAFLEYSEEEAATKAIETLDGRELGGRNIRVTKAEDRRGPSGPPGGGGGGRPPGGGFKKSRPKGSRRNLRGRKRSL
jgi:RNA recognition motif-containing protein